MWIMIDCNCDWSIKWNIQNGMTFWDENKQQQQKVGGAYFY